jgi:LysR family glycine cleavage system transcriptional activator
MRRALPPFPALQAFEASARLGSFSRAAEELCVTQSAISHRIKEIEEFLGVSLFRRLTRKIVLTRYGEDYLASLGDVLDRLHEATLGVRDAGLEGPLTVCGTPGFVTRWLLPRLSSFTAAYPAIELHVSTAVVTAERSGEEADIVIAWGAKQRDGYRSDPFLETSSFPVAAPALLREAPPLASPRDLLDHVLLHEEVDDDWPRWFGLAGLDCDDAMDGPRFAHCDLAMQAAVSGQGVALAFDELAAPELAAGRLVRCFDISLPRRKIYSVIIPEMQIKRPRIAAFRNWILTEGSRSQH